MPANFATFCKPRNIRGVIFLLVLTTLIFALYFLLYGSAYDSGPTIFVNHQSNKYQETILENQQPPSRVGVKTNLLEKQIVQDAELNLIPRYNKGFSNAASKYARENGRCPKIQIFKPDIDVNEIYQDLEFDAEWIRSKEYWNVFFEQRYKSIKESKKTPPMKIFVIPHSHNDPGWLKTFEEYYQQQTRHVLDNAVEKLTAFKNMTFLWSEISFLSKWWHDAHPRKRLLLKNLVKEGRLEIVTGGFVMTDEATVNLYSMIDQLIEGQQWTKMHLDIVPRTSWSVDPFGHGSTFPYILNKAGVKGMVIQRIHYGWKKWMMVHQASDFQWVQRFDYANKHSISTHNAPFDIYSIKHSCGPHPQICLNFDFRNIPGEYSENSVIMQPITTKNVKEKAELMLEQYGRTASLFPHNMAMISMGDDFRFTNPLEWDQQYDNYMQLFDYINSHKEKYNAEVKFGTVLDYFDALKERNYHFPTFSGDFHVYSDIFSDGRPAYWSGYYGTRPYWKKFYRETENVLRGAEIVFTFSNVLSNQKQLTHSQQVLTKSYEDLTTARRWLALFAHHDASTGTSKAHTMLDYGNKLLEAYQLGKQVQMNAIETILYGKADGGKLGTDLEFDGFGEQPRQISISFENEPIKKVVLYNTLARQRFQIVTLVVNTQYVEVVGPSGEYIQAQINPVVDTSNGSAMLLSADVFELSFFASLAPLSLSVFQVKKSLPIGQHNAVHAQVYCKSCKSLNDIFQINQIQNSDIELNNDRITVLFDRSTGMIIHVKKIKENVTFPIEMQFGSYSPVNFRSGAYLLMPDVQSEQEIPFPNSPSQMIIISGPVQSELSIFHDPILLSSKIMHVGDNRILEAVYIQNQIDLGQHNGEMYMRFDTNLNTVSKKSGHSTTTTTATIPKRSIDAQNYALHDQPEVVKSDDNNNPSHQQPTFYTDQAGFTVEKRIKVPTINYQGNSYPVNTMAFVQDDARKLRFSVLVDRSHGFSSMKTGRLEALVERRTVYDDGRGMGEGVVDNKPTTSNYILLFENLGPKDKVRHAEHDYRNYQPTLGAHYHSQELSYPAFVYSVINDESTTSLRDGKTANDNKGAVGIFPFLSSELPCDSHLLNLRTVADSSFNPDLNFPSLNALLIVQKLGYLCTSLTEGEKPGCGNPNPMSLFYPQTKFNGINVKEISQSNLAGVESFPNSNNIISHLHDIVAEPFEINTVIVKFNSY